MPATVIVGAQWGDEGKGKIVDLLAQESDLVCRYQGGPNAGHTIVVDGETYKIRAIPSGIVGGVASAIGAGCVVDPQVLIDELDELERRGHRTDGLVFVSGNAHLIMPWHVALDGARERRLGKLQIGTTRRGIGPAYADKATRIGIRVQDLLDPKILREKIELAAGEKNVWLERVYGIEPFDVDEVVERTLAHAERLAPYVADTSLLVDRALRDGRKVLFEGAQGTLLDLDHGTYPFVTSSSPIAAGAAVSFGIGPQRIDEVVGVVEGVRDARRRRAVPERDRGPAQERVRELGGEFGTVTGRERRCGWLDLVALRFAVRVNGITSLALTKLDVLSEFDEIPVCVRYRLPDGSETDDFPAHQSDFHHCAPVFETLPGWREELTGPASRPRRRPTSRSSPTRSAFRSRSSARARRATRCSRCRAPVTRATVERGATRPVELVDSRGARSPRRLGRSRARARLAARLVAVADRAPCGAGESRDRGARDVSSGRARTTPTGCSGSRARSASSSSSSAPRRRSSPVSPTSCGMPGSPSSGRRPRRRGSRARSGSRRT